MRDISYRTPVWTRRIWVGWMAKQSAVSAAALSYVTRDRFGKYREAFGKLPAQSHTPDDTAPLADLGPLQTMALQAVDAARHAGATYADARLTRTVCQQYLMVNGGLLIHNWERLGVGVRALVNGYWGFSASPSWTTDTVAAAARAAVGLAQENARGPARVVELGQISAVRGTWSTPVEIDPFTVPFEEKFDYITFWKNCAAQNGLTLHLQGASSGMTFGRQESVIATSDGSLVTQTTFDSGGAIELDPLNASPQEAGKFMMTVDGLDYAGKGWELFLNADIPGQMKRVSDGMRQREIDVQKSHGGSIGRYTLVCDGATMASLTDRTLGIATQLDRALGYEANAGGTSILTDPLAMVGQFQIASPQVTVTTNRSAPAQLATVQWDVEGVVPAPTTLVNKGIVTDFQTTREQAAWLAPYYHRQGRPVRSNGCSGAQDGLFVPMQRVPNLALEPNSADIGLDALVADVKDGLLITGGEARCDFQARTGLLYGKDVWRILNGRVAYRMRGGAIQFDTLDLWKKVKVVGGARTKKVQGESMYHGAPWKGEPMQMTSYSVQGVAATILDQAVIDPDAKG